jgi:predicted transcriptional regulator
MPIYMTCEADLNFPFPHTDRLLAHLRTLFDGTKPVTTRDVAAAVGGDVLAVEDVLRRAANNGLVRRIGEKGWLPLAN